MAKTTEDALPLGARLFPGVDLKLWLLLLSALLLTSAVVVAAVAGLS